MRGKRVVSVAAWLFVLASAAAAAAQQPVTIVMEAGGNPDELETRRIAIDAFMRENPDIQVDFRALQGGTAERITRYVGGAAPDVTMEWELEFAALARQNVYLDLDQFISADTEYRNVLATDTLRPLLQVFQWNGRQYVLPEQYAAVVIFYNTQHYDETGLAEPPTDWDDPSWTWDAFLENAQKLTRRDGDEVERFGYADMWWTELSMMLWGWSNGGTWFDRLNQPTRSTLSDPRMVEAIQFYTDLWNRWEVAPTWDERVARGTEDRFMAGNVSMGQTGHWWVPGFSQSGISYDVAPLPRGPQGTSGMSDLGTTGLGIYNTTEHPEAAWRLVKFLTGPEGQAIYANSGLFVPVVRSAVPAFLDTDLHSPRAEIFFTAANHAKPLPTTVHWGDYVSQAFNPILFQVVLGENNAQAAAAESERIANTILAGH